jgi:hypothetical protein
MPAPRDFINKIKDLPIGFQMGTASNCCRKGGDRDNVSHANRYCKPPVPVPPQPV